jgi:choline dehydrogenase-like flavoprotein
VIQDLNELEAGVKLAASVAIVGGGVAGIILATSLAESGRSVLLLEGGGEEHEAESQSLYDGEVADQALHAPLTTYRERRLGGTSTIWGGRCVPFDPIDFEQRDWIPQSGWPFGQEELLPFYEGGNAFCEAGRFAYSAGQAFPNGGRPIISGFAGRSFTDDTLERFSCPSDFGTRYKGRLRSEPNIRVLLHANVTRINANESGEVRSLTVKTLGGKEFSVAAATFILAAGGLEIPRLLLTSTGHHQAGLGNGHGWVGRTYMCHIAGTIGQLKVAVPSGVSHGYDISQEGIYCRRRFLLKASAQRQMRVGSFVARLHHPRIPDPSHRTGFLSALFLMKPFISYEYRKRLHGEGALDWRDLLGHLRNLACDSVDTACTLAHWVFTHTLADRKFPSIIVRPKSGVYSLDFNAEQEPNQDSRVTLTGERDRLGQQKIRVDWRYTDNDIRTVRMSLKALAADLEACGAATLRFNEDEVEPCAIRDGAYGGHHIGTTRMSASPRYGVVDSDCRVHGTPNLYIASSSVFPTSSHANPTLTIAALSLRLAKHLQAA